MSLHELASEPVAGDENAISKKLCPILTSVCFALSRSRNIEVRTPTWEGPIQPVLEHEVETEPKRPDFTCKLCNPYATSKEDHEISLHVECKCLGFPTSPSWILNKNYVLRGMKRFDCNTHKYGKRASSGIMIGYIVNMKPIEILKEVNHYRQKHLYYFPDVSIVFDKAKVFQNKHNVKRKYIKPKEFDLTHIWVDLR